MRYILLFLSLFSVAFAQNQTVRGIITDKETHFPLEGVMVMIFADTTTAEGIYTEADGVFRFENIPIGRYQLQFDLIGYSPISMSNVSVTSGKEVVLNVEMEGAAVQTKEVVIRASKNGDPLNEMAVGSARSFSVEETDRYAGSRGDPSRMASNFAGVQGADDSRNDIVIRGNSPAGVLWRLEGIDIPNPNHFAIPGTTGGPINILNNKILANSDFYTGAFPAEFGNGTAGAFDLRLRNGNNQRHETSAQFGIMGLELATEGPLSKKSGASYLATYRYSTLGMFNALGIDVGTSSIPRYMDGSFKINFPLKNNAFVSLFGIGGTSNVDLLVSKNKDPKNTELYGENTKDQFFKSQIYQVGATYSKAFNKNTYFKAVVGASKQQVDAFHRYLYRSVNQDSTEFIELLPPQDYMRYVFGQKQYSANAFVSHKVGEKVTIKAGVINNFYALTYIDSVRKSFDTLSPVFDEFQVRWNTNNAFSYIGQIYVQAKYRLSQKWTLNGGLHSQYASLGNSFSPIEPRLSAKYDLNEKQYFAVSYGFHSQIQSPYLYFYLRDGKTAENIDMKMSRSHHFVGTYSRQIGKAMNFKSEVYYQYLFNAPISTAINSFSLINTGRGFARFFPDTTLVNKGVGYNYGVEASLEKFFTKNYYFMVNGSLFNSQYKGSDNVWRSTDFNNVYVLNALFTKQFDLGKSKKHSLEIGGKLTTSGGILYSPVDSAASAAAGEIIDVSATKNSLRFPPYFRTDLRLAYHANGKRMTHTVAFDLINVSDFFGHKNLLRLSYAPDGKGNFIQQEYQIGFLPIFYYRIDFNWGKRE